MAGKSKDGMRKDTTEPHPLFSGNPAQYADDVEHRQDDECDCGVGDLIGMVGGTHEKSCPARGEFTPAAMAQQGRWTRQ